jgi:hypothetical protein
LLKVHEDMRPRLDSGGASPVADRLFETTLVACYNYDNMSLQGLALLSCVR